MREREREGTAHSDELEPSFSRTRPFSLANVSSAFFGVPPSALRLRLRRAVAPSRRLLRSDVAEDEEVGHSRFRCHCLRVKSPFQRDVLRSGGEERERCTRRIRPLLSSLLLPSHLISSRLLSSIRISAILQSAIEFHTGHADSHQCPLFPSFILFPIPPNPCGMCVLVVRVAPAGALSSSEKEHFFLVDISHLS